MPSSCVLCAAVSANLCIIIHFTGGGGGLVPFALVVGPQRRHDDDDDEDVLMKLEFLCCWGFGLAVCKLP